jgi:hypothetical protein
LWAWRETRYVAVGQRVTDGNEFETYTPSDDAWRKVQEFAAGGHRYRHGSVGAGDVVDQPPKAFPLGNNNFLPLFQPPGHIN